MIRHEMDQYVLPEGTAERRQGGPRREPHSGRRALDEGDDVSSDELRALIDAHQTGRIREDDLRDRAQQRLERDVVDILTEMAALRRRVYTWGGAFAVVVFVGGALLTWFLRTLGAP